MAIHLVLTNHNLFGINQGNGSDMTFVAGATKIILKSLTIVYV